MSKISIHTSVVFPPLSGFMNGFDATGRCTAVAKVESVEEVETAAAWKHLPEVNSASDNLPIT